MSHGTWVFAVLLAFGTAAGCSSPETMDPDAGRDGGDGDVGPSQCSGPGDCSDGLFCTGVERCDPGAPDADEHGCAPASAAPCLATQECDEEANECRTSCDLDPDADADGHRAAECGGDDCDDADPERFPGNPEVCDNEDWDGDGVGEGRDEDCNPSTTGPDLDGDGFVADVCCNPPLSAGEPNCGADCDDSTPDVSPSAPESCNDVDDNCDGHVDEGVLTRFWPDEDEDGYGATDGPAVDACSAPDDHVDVAGDCDDDDPFVHRGQHELCNGIDDNCAGGIDEEPQAVDNSCRDLPDTTFACVAGECEVTACPSDRLDCNGAGDDGCEVDPLTDREHCSDCDTACTFNCLGGTCDELESISAGRFHTCALRSSGLVACWGGNLHGQIGDGTFIERHGPSDVYGLTDVTVVSAGQDHCCAVRSLGDVYCWGSDAYGQLGRGLAAADSPSAVPVPALAAPSLLCVDVVAGGEHSCAIAQTATVVGSVYCWGRNEEGQLGRGTTASPLAQPSLVVLEGGEYLLDAIAVGAGARHTCAIRAGGQVFCWGSGAAGQLGDGLATTSSTPVAVTGLDDATHLALGSEHACAIRDAPGQVVCWGSNSGGQLGVAAPATYAVTPVAVAELPDAAAITAGGGHTCAVREAGDVVCWGQGTEGQLGDGLSVNSTEPVTVSTLSAPLDLSAGYQHTCAVRAAASGGGACWGRNSVGQLGDDSTTDRAVPTDVSPL